MGANIIVPSKQSSKVLIPRTTLGASVSEVIIPIAQEGYRDLIIRVGAKVDGVGNTWHTYLKVNEDDTVANYGYRYNRLLTSATSGIVSVGGQASVMPFYCANNNHANDLLGFMECRFIDYKGSQNPKYCWYENSIWSYNSTPAYEPFMYLGQGIYLDSDPITQLTIDGAGVNYVAGTWYEVFVDNAE